MDNQTLETIKKDLLAKKEQIEKELASAPNSSKTKAGDFKAAFPEYGDQSDENAQEVNEYTTNIETERILENTLKDIDSTLAKIDKGEYGICKYCHQEIDTKRLLIRPFSSACFACKTKLQNTK